MRRFLDGHVSADDFTDEYMNAFKNDDAMYDDALFETLNGIFTDADCFTHDETQSGPWVVHEPELREHVAEALAKLDSLIAAHRD